MVKNIVEPNEFGLVIKVNNLDSCRLFYRKLLNLGEPVIDSTYLVVFQLTENVSFSLEQTRAQYLEHASNAAALRFRVDDLAVFRTRMEEAGYECNFEEATRASGPCCRGLDPEGNPFYVSEKTK